MKTAHILALLVAVTAVAGVVDARDMALHIQSGGWAVLSTLLFSYLSFYWYRLDREAHLYRGSRWLSIGIVMLAIVPCLTTSCAAVRPAGRGARCCGSPVLPCCWAPRARSAASLTNGWRPPPSDPVP